MNYAENQAKSSPHEHDRQFVSSLARGLALLQAFERGEYRLSNQQLAERTGLPKSTVSRLSYTLTQLGYLVQDGETGSYSPGPDALAMASTLLGNIDAKQIMAPLMRAFCQEHGISVSLGMPTGTDMVYLDSYRSQSRVAVQLSIGSRVPLATTAMGRAYYASLSTAERQTLALRLANHYGAAWPSIAAHLASSCEQYDALGFCTSFGEFEPDVMAVGIALPLFFGNVQRLSLNASGPAGAFTRDIMLQQIGPGLLAMREHMRHAAR